ncbi:hypothetical protein PpBr36_07671 [Pyricularia pennisetigena]|uniref:hypothetical protein n=1 Tax=Pyricularia pennisetigena TaxID=1578925 RepID=UPI001154E60F|nr:hypothetical protein PpBr36_07671 [Pyricularia pennisetigena]TLS25351.1 hypothetical protein PpBr36_07671 [Pyricularia pennisetigena]
MPRHVGLSYKAQPKPLLKQVGGVSVEPNMKAKLVNSGKRKGRSGSGSEPERASSSRPEPEFDDPPLSTSESEDSGDESNRRADIKPTTFVSKKDLPPSKMNSKAGNGVREAPRRASSRVAKFTMPSTIDSDDIQDSDEDTRASKRSKTSQDTDTTPFGSQHSFGSSQRTADQKKYGGSQKTLNKSYKQNKNRMMETKTIRVPKRRGRPRTPEVPRARFSMPSVDGIESPSKSGGQFISVGPDSSPVSSVKNYNASAVLDSSPMKPRSAFQPLLGDEDVQVPVSSAALSDSSELSEAESMPDPNADVCPMCDAPIDSDLAKDLSNRYMSITEQQKFCRRHKVRESTALWKERGYPDIDWDELEKRFEEHTDHLGQVLEAKTKSHYRDALSRKVKSGKGRTLLTSQTSLTPGYYGFRGLRLMTEYLVKRFSRQLRERAIQDRLVAARGHTTFVQSVLVPELAVQLMMEDLDIEAEAARDVLQESAKLGELLHEEDKDVIHDLGDDMELEEKIPCLIVSVGFECGIHFCTRQSDALLLGWHILLQDFVYIQTRKVSFDMCFLVHSKCNPGWTLDDTTILNRGSFLYSRARITWDKEVKRSQVWSGNKKGLSAPTLHEAKQPSPALKPRQKLCFSVVQSTQQPRDLWLALRGRWLSVWSPSLDPEIMKLQLTG